MCVRRDSVVEVGARVEESSYTRRAISFSSAGRQSQRNQLSGKLEIFGRQGEGVAHRCFSHACHMGWCASCGIVERRRTLFTRSRQDRYSVPTTRDVRGPRLRKRGCIRWYAKYL